MYDAQTPIKTYILAKFLSNWLSVLSCRKLNYIYKSSETAALSLFNWKSLSAVSTKIYAYILIVVYKSPNFGNRQLLNAHVELISVSRFVMKC